VLATLGVGVLTALAAGIDLRSRRVPNSLSLAIIVTAALALWLFPAMILSPGWGASAVGMVAAGALLLPGYMLGAMGAGDIKLVAALGFALGWPLAMPMVLVAMVALGVWCAVAWLAGRRGRQPAAPAIAVGAFTVILLHVVRAGFG
jgi:prepilin peptidase CpaA